MSQGNSNLEMTLQVVKCKAFDSQSPMIRMTFFGVASVMKHSCVSEKDFAATCSVPDVFEATASHFEEGLKP